MEKLYNSATAATALGWHGSQVSRLCAKHGIGMRVGRNLLLTQADLARLKKLKRSAPGNPNFVAGNHFGQPPKKEEKSK